LHLKSLTLRGFKSFATATTFEFEPGITCVVGPNGSGKSNIVDALAWVLGEQGAKSLRGGKMDDVVFAGTATRPPLGRAEVVLTIDNSDGALPIDYAEVTISRTLFRNGGSEYALNGQPCRLLDVQDLLSDSGIGREMHVVVGQGQLDSILHATPEERRGFVEEAAGVLKHRKRKEKALRKLEATDANLVRLQDLLGEIRRQLKPLGRQAEVARKAAAVQADARDARARLLADDIAEARDQLAREVADETALRRRRADVESALTGVRDHERELEGALRGLGPRLSRAQEVWYHLSGLRERIKATGELAAERVRLSEHEPADAGGGGGTDPDVLEGQAAQLRQQEHTIAAEIAAKRRVLDQAVSDREAAERAAAEEDRRLADVLRAQADRREGLARLTGAVQTWRIRVRSAEEELSRLAAVRTDATQRMQRATHDFTALETQVAGLDAGEHGLDAEHEGAVSQLRDVTERLAKHREEAQRADRERAGLAARVEALHLGLVRRDGATALLEAGDTVRGVRDSAAALLRVRPGYEAAVAAALGDAADAVAVSDLTSAAGAIDHLREHDLGRAGLMVAGAPPVGSVRPPLPEGATYLLDAVEQPPDLAAAVERLLGGVAVVPDLSIARKLVAERPELVAVTLAGDVLGTHFAAGGSSQTQSRLELQVAYDQAQQSLDESVAAGERLRFELSRLEDERVVAQRRVDVALARLHESDAAMAAVAERLGELATAARAARDEVDRVGDAISSVEQSLAAHRATLAEHEKRLQEAEQVPLTEPDTALRDKLAGAAAQARRAEVDARLALRTAEERVRALSGRADALLAAAAAERSARVRAAARRARQEEDRRLAQAVLAAAGIVTQHLAQSLELAGARRAELEEQRSSADQRLDQTRIRARELAAELDRLTDSVHRDEVARAEQRLRVEQLEQRAAEELGLDVETLLRDYGPQVAVPVAATQPDAEAPVPVPYVRAEQLERLRTAERSLALLGRINPLALEEFGALEERHAFLAAQLEDVRRTRSDLLEIVRDVDARVEEVFAAAWHDTARQFADVFARLFPGGEGRLVLTDPDDMLGTGIEVEARPPGKKVKRLSLLSGGERALVAVAFLVALFKARPSPFYILDEVEAALDDTNLSRLLGIYTELRSTSQLIVVTHQKRTMEIADALYGISMRDDGVSTVISSRLRDGEPA